MTLHEAELYDKAQRIKADLALEKQREFYRKIKLQELDKDIPDYPRELRPDTTPHKCQWSEVVKHAFSKNFIRGMLP